MLRGFHSLLIVAVVTGCSPATNKHRANDEQKPEVAPDIKMALTPLPKGAAQATIELERRLDALLDVKDGFLIVYDLGIGKMNRHILPASSSWSLNCGLGFSIVFGSELSGDRDSVENDVRLSLSSAGLVPKPVCDVVGLAVARHLREKLAAKF
jgi:hypothetical protein